MDEKLNLPILDKKCTNLHVREGRGGGRGREEGEGRREKGEGRRENQ